MGASSYPAGSPNAVTTATGATYVALAPTLTGTNGTFSALKISPTLGLSGTAGFNAIWLNATESSGGSGPANLLLLQASNVDKFAVDDTGAVSSANIGATVSDTNNTSATTLLQLNHFLSGGTAGAGMAARISAKMHDAGGAPRSAGALQWAWTAATSGTPSSQWELQTNNAGSVATRVTVSPAGLLTATGGFSGSGALVTGVTAATVATDGVTADALAATALRFLAGVGLASAGAVTLTGAKVGDRVVGVLTPGVTQTANFEATISVDNQIQQTGGVLTALTLSVQLVAKGG